MESIFTHRIHHQITLFVLKTNGRSQLFVCLVGISDVQTSHLSFQIDLGEG